MYIKGVFYIMKISFHLLFSARLYMGDSLNKWLSLLLKKASFTSLLTMLIDNTWAIRLITDFLLLNSAVYICESPMYCC